MGRTLSRVKEAELEGGAALVDGVVREGLPAELTLEERSD